MARPWTRRRFLTTASAAGAGFTLGAGPVSAAGDKKPALLGGKPARNGPFPSWPVFDEREEDALLKVLRSGKWFRGWGSHVARFEQAYAERMGAKHCVATASGTTALFTALTAVGVQAGDEVILPPYTFVACVNVILGMNALPVFVDTDPETFQIDASKIEPAITDRTAALMPVHLGGNVADLDAILAVAGRHKVPVVEDTCQSHLAEWKGRKAGTHGTAGCFSFQASKNLNSGEGGAVLARSDEVGNQCHAVHNHGRGRAGATGSRYVRQGMNFRMTEFQAAILLAQMTRIEEFARRREENAGYLSDMLRQIPGIRPARMYEGCTRNAYHLYMFRYDKEAFAGLGRSAFLKALSAEGVSASGGYSPLNKASFIRDMLQSRGFRRLFPKERLDWWDEQNACPANDRLCTEAVWMTQNVLLAERAEMDRIAEAVRKIQKHARDLVRA